MDELLAKLGIHWTQLLAQIVNFAIVAGALTYFLYHPLLDVIEERQKRIRKSLEDAERIARQREELDRIRTDALAKVDRETGEILTHAREDAEKLRQELLAAAHREADAVMIRARKQIEEERQKVFSEAQQKITGMIIRMTESLIEREFSPADQKRIIVKLEQDLPALAR